MIRLYITRTDEISLERADEISSERAEKVKRLRLDDDKKRCIAGGLFINRFLADAEITINEFGKPIADNGMYFNISHSGEYVLFALSDSEIGCDIEQRRQVEPMRLGKIVFCQNELDYIENSADSSMAFYELWTRKESLLKCIGEGFHRSSKSVDVSKPEFAESGTEYKFRMWDMDGYTISVCSAQSNIPQNIEYISL